MRRVGNVMVLKLRGCDEDLIALHASYRIVGRNVVLGASVVSHAIEVGYAALDAPF